MDEPQPEPRAVTAADLAEAAARAGLAGFYTERGRGFGKGKIRPVKPAPVRSQVENGAIPWVDTYLDSDSAFRTPLDPRMLRPAEDPKPNRADRRRNRRRRR